MALERAARPPRYSKGLSGRASNKGHFGRKAYDKAMKTPAKRRRGGRRK